MTLPLTAEWRATAEKRLTDLGKAIAGPDVPSLINLIEEACTAFHTTTPANHPSLNDFVPAHLRASFDAREQECQEALHELIRAAQSAVALLRTPSDLAPCEVDPFTGALLGYLESGSEPNDQKLESVASAIHLLAHLSLNPERAKSRGRKPVRDLARIVVRATYYYRSLYDMGLEINFDYIAPRGAGLSPRTPTARLAWEAVRLLNDGTKVAQVKTHLDNYRDELGKPERSPQKTDFVADYSWYAP